MLSNQVSRWWPRWATPRLCSAVDADPPDVCIVDIRMPPTNTTEGSRRRCTCACTPGCRLVLSQYVETRFAIELLAAVRRLGYCSRIASARLRAAAQCARWWRPLGHRPHRGEPAGRPPRRPTRWNLTARSASAGTDGEEGRIAPSRASFLSPKTWSPRLAIFSKLGIEDTRTTTAGCSRAHLAARRQQKCRRSRQPPTTRIRDTGAERRAREEGQRASQASAEPRVWALPWSLKNEWRARDRS